MRFRSFVGRALAAALCIASIGALGACEPSSGPGARAPRKGLPAYGGHAAELFDDAIEPRAVGLEIDQSMTAKVDPILRERTKTADAIATVQVTTVTSKNEDSGASYSLGLRIQQVLFGGHPPPNEFTVNVRKGSPSAGLVRSLESRIVGKRFVVFVREFASGDESELHFHAVADTKDELAAIRDAAALAEMK